MEDFEKALTEKNLMALREIPKADLHNHFVPGGSRDYIRQKTGIRIDPLTSPLSSMDEMHAWYGKYMGAHFESVGMRKELIRATFHQAGAGAM